MSPTDRILRIGKKLEKTGFKGFGHTTPSGHPAYFRAQGLQIIPSEAEEIDTGKSCRLVITPLAASLSGLISDILKVLAELPAGLRRVESLIHELKTNLFKGASPPGDWEQSVAKNIVSASLKLAERQFEDAQAKCEDWGGLDPFTCDINEHRRNDWSHAQEILGRHLGYRRRSATFPSEPPCAQSLMSSAPTLQWVDVLGHVGVVISGFWIPVVGIERLAGPRRQAALVKALIRRNLKPDIGLTIIANRAKKPKRSSR